MQIKEFLKVLTDLSSSQTFSRHQKHLQKAKMTSINLMINFIFKELKIKIRLIIITLVIELLSFRIQKTIKILGKSLNLKIIMWSQIFKMLTLFARQEKMDFVEICIQYFAILKQKLSKNYQKNILENKNNKNKEKDYLNNKLNRNKF